MIWGVTFGAEALPIIQCQQKCHPEWMPNCASRMNRNSGGRFKQVPWKLPIKSIHPKLAKFRKLTINSWIKTGCLRITAGFHTCESSQITPDQRNHRISPQKVHWRMLPKRYINAGTNQCLLHARPNRSNPSFSWAMAGVAPGSYPQVVFKRWA